MRIVITGDLRRPNPQQQNIEFLYHLIQYQLFLISGIKCELLSTGEDILSVYEWAKKYNSAETYISEKISNAIIIGFEIPPTLVTQFQKSNNKIINIGLSPIRFTHDLNWTIEANYSIDISKWFIPEEQINYEASLTSAAAIRLPGVACDKNSLLIIGQTPSDRSMIKDNKIMSLSSYANEILKLTKKHSTVLFKSHPHSSSGESFLIQNEVDYVNVKDLNIYRLLTEPNISTVVAVSSSVLEEAKYFNKKSIRFIEGKTVQSIGTASLLDPNFWRDVFNPIIQTVEAPKIDLQPSRDLARKIVRSYWGMDFLR